MSKVYYIKEGKLIKTREYIRQIRMMKIKSIFKLN